jgi:hypothetical protein
MRDSLPLFQGGVSGIFGDEHGKSPHAPLYKGGGLSNAKRVNDFCRVELVAEALGTPARPHMALDQLCVEADEGLPHRWSGRQSNQHRRDFFYCSSPGALWRAAGELASHRGFPHAPPSFDTSDARPCGGLWRTTCHELLDRRVWLESGAPGSVSGFPMQAAEATIARPQIRWRR